VAYCGICGSDLHLLRAGLLPEGAVLGHEIVGEIVALGPEARGFEVGDRVTTLSAVPCDDCPKCRQGLYRSCEKGWQVFGYTGLAGGYAELLLTHTAALEKISDDLSDIGAALNEPSMVGLYAARTSRVRTGDTVAIIEAGPIGLLVLQSVLLSNPAKCWVIETSAGRRKTALECGAGFDAWCKDLDAKTNSEARRAGERQCLTPDNCDKDKAKDCIYRSYAKAQRSAAQDALLTAYCQTCFASAGDVALCKAAAPAYDPAKGPGSVTDVFLAVWELSDALATSIKDKCTGAALDGGAPADGGDGGVDCARAFAVCAGGLYVDALPNCP